MIILTGAKTKTNYYINPFMISSFSEGMLSKYYDTDHDRKVTIVSLTQQAANPKFFVVEESAESIERMLKDKNVRD